MIDTSQLQLFVLNLCGILQSSTFGQQPLWRPQAEESGHWYQYIPCFHFGNQSGIFSPYQTPLNAGSFLLPVTDNFTESGYIIFSIAVSHENVYKVIPIILDEFNRLAEGDISDEEIEIAKGHLIGSIYANVERSLDYVDWYGMQELLNPQNVLSVEEQIKVYKSIDKKVIKRITSKYLNRSKILVGVVDKVDESSIKNLLK